MRRCQGRMSITLMSFVMNKGWAKDTIFFTSYLRFVHLMQNAFLYMFYWSFGCVIFVNEIFYTLSHCKTADITVQYKTLYSLHHQVVMKNVSLAEHWQHDFSDGKDWWMSWKRAAETLKKYHMGLEWCDRVRKWWHNTYFSLKAHFK